MRIDDFLSTVGLVKRRSVAKELADNGLVQVNGRPVKASYQVRPQDIVAIRGSHPLTAEVLDVPTGSVAKAARDKFVKLLA